MPPTFTDEGLRAAVELRAGAARARRAGAVAVRRGALRHRAARRRARRRRLPAQGARRRRQRLRRAPAPGGRRRHRARPRGRRPAAGAAAAGATRSTAHPARARGARPDGRGAVQRRHRRSASCVSEGAVEKHITTIFAKLDLPHDRDRAPPGARRAHLPRGPADVCQIGRSSGRLARHDDHRRADQHPPRASRPRWPT